MSFGNDMLNKVNVKIQNVCIERVRGTMFLGGFIDDLLNWIAHTKCPIKAFKMYRYNAYK